MALGNALLNLMGNKDPKSALMASMLSSTAGTGAPAPGVTGVATPSATAGAPGAVPPAPKPIAAAYTSPPDLLELYSQLSDRSRKEGNIDRGIGLIGASLAQPQNRQMVMDAMSGGSGGAGAGSNPNDMMGTIMEIRKQQMASDARNSAISRIPAIAQKYGMDPTVARVLFDNDQLDDYIMEKEKAPDKTADQKNYEYYVKQETENQRAPLSYNEWDLQSKKAGATSVNIDTTGAAGLKGPGAKLFETAQDEIIKNDMPAAKSAVETGDYLNTARAALDAQGGIISGSKFAPIELETRKLFADMFGFKDDASINSDQYAAAMGPVVTARIKELGTGNAISDADLKFTTQAVGKDNTLSAESMPRILNALEIGSRNKVMDFNKKIDGLMEGYKDPSTGIIPPAIEAQLSSMKIQVPYLSTSVLSHVNPADLTLMSEHIDDPQYVKFFEEKYGRNTAQEMVRLSNGEPL